LTVLTEEDSGHMWRTYLFRTWCQNRDRCGKCVI